MRMHSLNNSVLQPQKRWLQILQARYRAMKCGGCTFHVDMSHTLQLSVSVVDPFDSLCVGCMVFLCRTKFQQIYRYIRFQSVFHNVSILFYTSTFIWYVNIYTYYILTNGTSWNSLIPSSWIRKKKREAVCWTLALQLLVELGAESANFMSDFGRMLDVFFLCWKSGCWKKHRLVGHIACKKNRITRQHIS